MVITEYLLQGSMLHDAYSNVYHVKMKKNNIELSGKMLMQSNLSPMEAAPGISLEQSFLHSKTNTITI